ncbi:FAD:protein FMN transferase [Mesorhizobium denitrificans]|uniref:FAD:protein FMN transferase n=1 Tax=Mesorhizobium denitrificans TaxID=2294114 RepID=A0A371X992_9HYPH|nr:FAD:protein FMN transferase [Mesorhizobium denitrificans]RFC65795.1 FAD:protein FMN transferase [Mesorhizobium denitrificans]
MASIVTRRRAIAIFAAAAGLPLIRPARAATHAVTWKGQALGAPATLILHHENRDKAQRLIDRVVTEVSRLEEVFSLYRSTSAISELNRVGGLVAPPAELVVLLEACRHHWHESGGAFDPTIQPLWALYRDHFSAPDADPDGPPADAIARAVGQVGFDAVRFNRDRIVFARPDMALTLNGIAQGYVTDRVVSILRDAGITSSMVDMGEGRAIGGQADGTPWRVGLADLQDAERPDSVLDLIDRAVATSSPAGFHFDTARRFGHILDPRNGGASAAYRRLTVVAPDATTADALSTVFSLTDPESIRSSLAGKPDIMVDLVLASGEHRRYGS